MTARLWRSRSFARRSARASAARSGQQQIGQFDALEIVPDALIRIEIRRVAGQLLQMQALGARLAQEVLDGLAVMDRRAIPDDQELPRDLAQQHAQEAHAASGES